MQDRKKFFWTLLILFLSVCSLITAQVNVYAQVSSKDVYVGESFIFQIVIEGTNNVEKPDLSLLTDFKAEYAGGGPQNSQSITIINGKTTQEVSYKYIIQYRLTPKSKGILKIPSLMITADGKTFHTNEMMIQAKEPSDVTDFKVRQYLSGTGGYIGEPVVYTLTWYFQNDVNSAVFNVPAMSDSRLRVADFPVDKSNNKIYEVKIANEQVTLVQSQQTFEGQLFNTLTFKKTLIPRTAGEMIIPKATIEFNGVAGYEEGYDFFDRKIRQPVMKKFVIASNELTFQVKDVPLTGKPDNFSGLIGVYEISISAAPVDVSVGDPITLNVTLKGKGNLADAKLPDLYKLKYLTKDFKIPEEISSGELKNNTKVFTQTIRPVHSQVKEIPSIVISYFNTANGKYEYAKSNTIPINVKPSTEFKMSDVEGTAGQVDKKEIEEAAEGILYNYDGQDVIVNQSVDVVNILRNPFIILLILLPVLLFFIVFYLYRLKPALHQQGGHKEATRKSYNKIINKFSRILNEKHELKESANLIFIELKNYLGLKLKVSSAGLTLNDIQKSLQFHQISEELMGRLRIIYNRYEALNYGAFNMSNEDFNRLYTDTCEIVKEIERSFK